MTRREALSLGAVAWMAPGAARGQIRGMGSRIVPAAPRGKPSGRPFHAKFVNVAPAAGLRQPVIYGHPDHADYIFEAMGCGAAFLDYDNDGWLDILLLNGRRREGTPDDATIRLYRNNRDGTFADVTQRAGIGRRPAWATGVTAGDYDNDGFEDLFITCRGQNVLLHNNGNGTFSDVTSAAGLLTPEPRYATGCTWLDYDRDGRLDLVVCHYTAYDEARIPARGKDPNCAYFGVPVFCGPGGLPQGNCRLYHNQGDGTFTDVSEKSGISAVKGYCLTAAAADFDGDGWTDVYVACDTAPSLYLHNNRDGTFTEQALERGVSLSEDGREQAGMGLGIGDYDGDGYLDIFKTHFRGDTAVLYRNNGKGYFRDTTLLAGLGVENRRVGWGAAIADLDNDGLPDLFFATGMVYPEAAARIPEAAWKTPPVLFRNLGGGRFEELTDEAGAAVGEAHSSRGAAFGDFDNDGDVDVLIVNLNEPPSLLRNDLVGGGHWLKVLLEGTKSNRSAIGAQVVATYGERRQAQAVLAQSSYLSVNDRRVHFGLGGADRASLEIRWPNGAVESIPDVAADQLVLIREGSGVVRRLPLRP